MFVVLWITIHNSSASRAIKLVVRNAQHTTREFDDNTSMYNDRDSTVSTTIHRRQTSTETKSLSAQNNSKEIHFVIHNALPNQLTDHPL